MIEHNSVQDEQGQTMAEYAISLSVITLVIAGTVTLLSDAVLAMFQEILDIVSTVV